MTSLSRAALASLPPPIARPGHDPAAIRTGVVHFGPGAFPGASVARSPEPMSTGVPENGSDCVHGFRDRACGARPE